MTALHYACKKQNIELIKLLIEEKSDVESKDNVGRTPLFYALLTENMDVIKVNIIIFLFLKVNSFNWCFTIHWNNVWIFEIKITKRNYRNFEILLNDKYFNEIRF